MSKFPKTLILALGLMTALVAIAYGLRGGDANGQAEGSSSHQPEPATPVLPRAQHHGTGSGETLSTKAQESRRQHGEKDLDGDGGDTESITASAADEVPMRPAYGESPAVRADASNPQAALVYQAMQSGSRDHRMLSILADPRPFDPDSFKRDPQPWLDRVEPARAWRPAQPGPDVPRLSRQSPAVVQIKQGETTDLTVKSAPHAMVTFTSVDLGAFANGLSAINVQADEHGLATATFHAVTGTLYDTDIQAASPMCSGVAKWVVHILPVKRIPVIVEDVSDASVTSTSQEQ